MRILTLLSLLLLSSIAFGQKGNWISIEEAVAKMQSDSIPKKIFVDVYTDWCGWCKRMDATTFSNDSLIAEMERMYYLVKLDAEQKEDIIIGDHTYSFVPEGRRGYNQLAAELLQGKMSYPTYVFIDESMKIIQIVPGYKDVASFGKISEFLGDDHFKTTSWEDFNAN